MSVIGCSLERLARGQETKPIHPDEAKRETDGASYCEGTNWTVEKKQTGSKLYTVLVL